MSDSNKRDEGMQDYMDLLDEMSKKDGANSEKIPSPPPIKEKDVEKSEFEDINSSSNKEKNPFKRLSGWYNNLPKKKKIVVSIIAVFLAIVLTLTTVLGIFIGKKFGLLGDNINGLEYDDTIYDDGEFDDINIDIGSAGFKQALQDWATQGNENKMSSKNVINVLLVGADSRQGTNSGNTDVMMLVSLNKKTKELKLVSFLRDSYLYIEGKNNSYCTKLNAAFSMGGPECLLQTIENNYKIEIDNYVMVNFESFKSIIDAMGGVTVDVQKYEADYNYTKFKINLPYGENVTLNGEQALCFCRIRGCDADGDVSRTRRQRQVIEAIIDKVTSASVSDLNKYIDILLPYVETGYSKTQIFSLGVQALTGKWYNYERTQLQMPDEECRTSGSANAWIWVVDYQLAAYKLQTELYGQSNITLPENRVSIIDIYRGASYSGSSSSGSSNTVTTAKNDKNSPETTMGTTAPETTQSVSSVVDDNDQNLETTAEVTENTTVPVTDIPDTTAVETTVSDTPSTTQGTLPPPEVTE
ncbi:MAG: LCP family protein [Acutalibacteraceae bacterium]